MSNSDQQILERNNHDLVLAAKLNTLLQAVDSACRFLDDDMDEEGGSIGSVLRESSARFQVEYFGQVIFGEVEV